MFTNVCCFSSELQGVPPLGIPALEVMGEHTEPVPGIFEKEESQRVDFDRQFYHVDSDEDRIQTDQVPTCTIFVHKIFKSKD